MTIENFNRKFRVYAPALIDSSMPAVIADSIVYGGDPDNPHIKYIEIEAVEIGDAYHTMHELYQHRMVLNAALFKSWNTWYYENQGIKVMKSKLHHDGTMFEGDYFIVMAVTPWGQISYHYDLKHWDVFNIPIVERTPPWDGHSSVQVMERLLKI